MNENQFDELLKQFGIEGILREMCRYPIARKKHWASRNADGSINGIISERKNLETIITKNHSESFKIGENADGSDHINLRNKISPGTLEVDSKKGDLIYGCVSFNVNADCILGSWFQVGTERSNLFSLQANGWSHVSLKGIFRSESDGKAKLEIFVDTHNKNADKGITFEEGSTLLINLGRCTNFEAT